MDKQLIGLPLQKSEEILRKQALDYYVEMISGGKDAQILTESYVVRVREKDKRIELTVTGFKTTI
ncbi:MAG: hypothetical protein Q4D77_07535 [Peptostreptococcaceae bacterium]|nr:hypothetical protein [Peptostreptococcaceae bacterium]